MCSCCIAEALESLVLCDRVLALRHEVQRFARLRVAADGTDRLLAALWCVVCRCRTAFLAVLSIRLRVCAARRREVSLEAQLLAVFDPAVSARNMALVACRSAVADGQT